jgi:hypothetical protein
VLVVIYALGDNLDFVDFPSETWAAILGVTKHSNEVEDMVVLADVLEGVETSVGDQRYFDHAEGDN